MVVNNLFNQNEEITIDSYLKKQGVEDIEEYLKPTGKYIEPIYNYDNIEYLTSEIIYWSKMKDETIFIVQDGDVDGVCSTIELYNYLKECGALCDIKILIHDGKKRGLADKKIMDRIEKDRPAFVIIPDAGSNDVEQAHQLTEMGIGLGVIDHHEIDTPIQDGYLVSNQVGNTDKCGSGAVVTHKVLQTLDSRLGVHLSHKYIDLVALSIISDSVDVKSMQNREYLHYGMFRSRNCIKNEFLNALFDRFIGDKEYTQKDISYSIIPKLNAICRSNDLKTKQLLLLSFMNRYDLDKMCDICEEAHLNQIELVSNFIENNINNIDMNDNIIVLASDDVPSSYSGLIAGKLSKLCDNKPTIVGSIENDYMIGSLRSPIPLRSKLNDTKLIEWAKGHKSACGICIKRENIDKIKSVEVDYNFKQDVACTYSVKRVPNRLFKEFLGYNTIWNNSFLPLPLFQLKGLYINTKDIQIIGKNKRTIKFNYNNIDFLIFNCKKEDKVNLKLGHYEDDNFITDNKNYKLNINILGHLGVNEWNNRTYNQCIISEYELISGDSISDVF